MAAITTKPSSSYLGPSGRAIGAKSSAIYKKSEKNIEFRFCSVSGNFRRFTVSEDVGSKTRNKTLIFSKRGGKKSK